MNENERMSQVFAVPLGAWDLSGNWYPNMRLLMTPEEQREHNIRNGFDCLLRKFDESYCCECGRVNLKTC
jgi:hypothetical protein